MNGCTKITDIPCGHIFERKREKKAVGDFGGVELETVDL